jgi:hypothetical protein
MTAHLTDVLARHAFWYTARRSRGLRLTEAIGPGDMARCTEPEATELTGTKTRVADEQAHRYDLE